ncbi:hypothetical protein GTY75_08985 [Streptomyces sp. SID8381]|uniref:hypothetical protein n=1 Tax=unclassified Streptomyces TaxID=2593676 RepID=UPI00037507D8|nr:MULTISPECIES: hypothetical protein [unclassified Streptomyces]MYX26801.1 hypothetical protein [Streptomyces sp. SID8381]
MRPPAPRQPSRPTAVTQAAAVRGRPGVKSNLAARLADDLLRAPVELRRQALKQHVGVAELPHLLREVERAVGSRFGLWADTPSGFIEDCLGETIWSKQRQIVDSVLTAKRIAVPAGFGVGKTWIAARLCAWAGCVNPAGTMVIVTTATRFRQVRNQLWPHIRKTIARAGLPGRADTTQWKIPDAYGNEVLVAYGFSAPEHDEAAMQGIHGTPKLLIIVDEAGGIARSVGNGTNNLLTGDAKMLAIGNPAMDDPRSWFELLCEEGEDPEEPTTITIPIATFDSPAITGERVPYCRDCPDGVPKHSLAIHLPDQDWVDRTLREYGEDHPYVQAKVYARFPKGGGGKAIPTLWVEYAQQVEDPTGPGYIRLCDLGLKGETATHTVKRGAWVRLGVDVAADGGDEFAIYRCVGDVIEHRHHSSGSENDNQVKVATRILEEIEQAQRLADALGSTAPVRVKVDQNGLGHGAVGMLKTWAENGRHRAEIVGVMVSESPGHDDPGAVMRPFKKRDEMWLACRALMQPDPHTGVGRLRLRTDRNAAIQLTTPKLGYNSGGHTVIESKKAMRARGMKSPDRAEAVLLSVYEPEPVIRRGGGLLV